MNFISDDLLVIILSYLNNKDSLSLVKTCKYFKKLFYERGFYKTIYYNFPEPILKFSNLFNIHNKTLNSVYINNGYNIHNFMDNIWCKNIEFSNYSFDYNIEPTNITNTENLYIVSSSNKKNKICINWNKFPKLKCLFLNIYDININNIEICDNLEVIFLYLEKSNKNNSLFPIIPKNIGLLKNLKHFFSNCNISSETKFISKNLETCILYDNNSEIVHNSKYNIIKNRNYYPEDIRILYKRFQNKYF